MTLLKSAQPSHEAHLTLKRLYEERVKISQEEFGKTYGIGSQSMVAQYLTGKRPLNIEAAAKFARGLACTIYDISPGMADALKEEVVSVLGPKSWRGRRLAAKVALVVLGISPVVAPSPADAGQLVSSGGSAVYYVKLVCAWIRRFIPKRAVVVS